ncbi:hypothetical protein [Paenarthrobacter nicotinovorans]|uniref:hypothetical protein n=1 Tax=Paenarthrobacter nicotinovorans TaxID=29320 RepID=UPI0016428B91|nr:hypothetical protein [Paenarthrobacter nicotinovorans]
MSRFRQGAAGKGFEGSFLGEAEHVGADHALFVRYEDCEYCPRGDVVGQGEQDGRAGVIDWVGCAEPSFEGGGGVAQTTMAKQERGGVNRGPVPALPPEADGAGEVEDRG